MEPDTPEVAKALAALRDAEEDYGREVRLVQTRYGDARARACARVVDLLGRQAAADRLKVTLAAIDKATGRARKSAPVGSSPPIAREADLARAVLSLADTAGMPDTFWQADSRIELARTVLGVSPDERYSRAELWFRTGRTPAGTQEAAP